MCSYISITLNFSNFVTDKLYYADCHRDIDLYIILDTSGSISSEEYEVAKNFMADLVSGFNIGENNVRVGLVLFGSGVYPIFDLDDSFDKAVISNWIRGAPDYGGSTATGDGILFAANTGFTEASGARPSNLAIPHIGIVLTDGHSTQGDEYLVNASTVARDLSIELFALGIDDGIDENELLVIAGSQDRVYRIDTFTNIDDARALITQGSCKGELLNIFSVANLINCYHHNWLTILALVNYTLPYKVLIKSSKVGCIHITYSFNSNTHKFTQWSHKFHL